jgi:L-lactate dehydrogenase complex protein LldG
MNRDEFLKNVRLAAESGRRYRAHVRTGLRHDDCRADAAGDLVEEYVREAANAGGRVQRCPDWNAAREELRGQFARYEPRSALCWRHPSLERLQLAALLDDAGIERIDAATLAALDDDARRQKILSADVGITGVTWAVAETGSLLLAHGRDSERLASLAPPVYFAIVERDRIVADLCDVFARASETYGSDLPSNMTFVTGPSKTGDIETKMVTGVHGPGKWHLIVVG